MRFTENGKGVLVLGAVGVDKTHLAAAAVNHLDRHATTASHPRRGGRIRPPARDTNHAGGPCDCVRVRSQPPSPSGRQACIQQTTWHVRAATEGRTHPITLPPPGLHSCAGGVPIRRPADDHCRDPGHHRSARRCSSDDPSRTRHRPRRRACTVPRVRRLAGRGGRRVLPEEEGPSPLPAGRPPAALPTGCRQGAHLAVRRRVATPPSSPQGNVVQDHRGSRPVGHRSPHCPALRQGRPRHKVLDPYPWLGTEALTWRHREVTPRSRPGRLP